jgi:hypothetical protein
MAGRDTTVGVRGVRAAIPAVVVHVLAHANLPGLEEEETRVRESKCGLPGGRIAKNSLVLCQS